MSETPNSGLGTARKLLKTTIALASLHLFGALNFMGGSILGVKVSADYQTVSKIFAVWLFLAIWKVFVCLRYERRFGQLPSPISQERKISMVNAMADQDMMLEFYQVTVDPDTPGIAPFYLEKMKVLKEGTFSEDKIFITIGESHSVRCLCALPDNILREQNRKKRWTQSVGIFGHPAGIDNILTPAVGILVWILTVLFGVLGF